MADALAAPVTFEALNDRHLALLEKQADDQLDAGEARAFVADAAAAGVQIESVSERDAVRSMINYWTATLARLPADAPGQMAEAAAAPAPLAASPRPALASFDASQSPTLEESANPFVGLAAFEVGQAANFFGRDAVVHDLLQHVLASPLVVVSGGSGTGKSSLVRAGLANALAADPQTKGWRVAVCSPGRDPIASLALALAPDGPDQSGWVETARTRLDQDPASAAALVAPATGLVLIVDQMEELFSLALPEQRDRAAVTIGSIAAAPGAHVVITIRDEYLEGERRHRTLPGLDLAGADEFRIPPLDPADIRAAITGPAAKAGLVFQDGLVDRIVADVGTDPAALPLLQYSLLRLWERRQGNRITAKVYDEVGGPATALPNAAEQIYQALGNDAARKNAAIIFQQLVRPSLVYEFVRDRVTRSELERLLPPQSINTVLQPYVDAALIRITRGTERGEDRIEIVHEALIRNWDRLRGWANETRERERAYLSLDAQAQRWANANRGLGHLLFGRALVDGEAVLDDERQRARVDPVSDARVTAFLQAGRSTQRRVVFWGSVVALCVLALVVTAILLDRKKDQSEASLLNTQEQATSDIKELSESTGSIAEKNVYLESRTSAAGTRAEVARQLIQMWLSRGTIRHDELPPVYSDMTLTAADFAVKPWLAAFERQARNGYPPVALAPNVPGLTQLNLPNARLFFDPAHALPIYTILLAQRSDNPIRVRSNALYRWPGLAGQPDEAALAARGIALARLFDGRDIAWGTDSQHAVLATNLLPAMVPIEPSGPSGRAFADWYKVGLWMRLNHNPRAKRVIYMTGAVPTPGAPNGAPPARLWVIATSYDANGQVVTDAATLPPISGPDVVADDLPGRASPAAIARLTGLGLPAQLSAAARPGSKSPSSGGGRPAGSPQAAPPPSPAPPLLGGSPPPGIAPSKMAYASSPATTGGIVYVQAVGLRPAQEEAITGALRAAGFRLTPVQRNVPCVSSPQLRYSDSGDAAQAARAAGVAGAAMRGAGLGDQNVALRRLDTQRYRKARVGVLELWLCNGGTAAY